MESKNLLTALNYIQEIAIYLLAAASILLFLPKTSEFYEFNKLIFAIFAAIVLLLSWSAKSLINKKLTVTKSKLDKAMFILLGSYVLSTVFSLNKIYSGIGVYGRFYPSLLSFFVLFILYYAISTSIRDKKTLKTVLSILTASAVVAALIGVLAPLGVLSKLPYAWLKYRAFNTLGSSTVLGIISGSFFTVNLSFLLYEYTKTKEKKDLKGIALQIAYLFGAVITLLYVILAKSTPAWISLAASFTLFFYFSPKSVLSSAKKFVFVTVLVSLVLIGASNLPKVRQLLGLQTITLPQEISLDFRTSWIISASALRDFPLVGTGLSNFSYSFSAYKPLSFNSTKFWTLNFSKPTSEFLRIISEQGLVGIFAVLFFIYALISTIKTTKFEDGNALLAGILGSALGIMFALTFYTLNVALSLILVLLLSLFTSFTKVYELGEAEDVVLNLSAVRERFLSLTSLGSGGEERKSEIAPYLFTVSSATICALLGFIAVRGFLAEIHHRNAYNAYSQGNGAAAYENFRRTIVYNPLFDAYRREYADINILLANAIAKKGKDLTDQDKREIQQLLTQAVREIKIATDNLGPLNVLNWEQRARVYNQLSGVAKGSDQWALDAAQRSIQLDPLNPLLRVGTQNIAGLGSLYYRNKDYAKASALFAEAIRLKPDYANAYYNLAITQKELKNYDLAVKNMEIVLRLLDKNSPDYKIAENTLKDLKSLQEEAYKKSVEKEAQKTQKPTEQTGQVAGEATTKAEKAPTPEKASQENAANQQPKTSENTNKPPVTEKTP